MTRAEIGQKAKEHREKKGITLYRITKDTGLTYNILKDIEAGENRNYSIDTLTTYLQAIGLQIDLKQIKDK